MGQQLSGNEFVSQIQVHLDLTLSPDIVSRQQGEKFLDSCSTVPGFGTSLIKIAQDASACPTVGQRQLSLVFFRRLVRERWSEGGISEPEKNHIKSILPQGLRENCSQMQTATGLVIAEIARWENVLTDWPDLMPGLINVIRENQDVVFSRGCLRALGLMIEDLDQKHVIDVSSLVLPQILLLCIGEHSSAEKKGKQDFYRAQYQALMMLHETIDSVEVMYRSSQEAKDLLHGHIASWFEAVRIVLSRPYDGDYDPYAWSCTYMALQCATRLIPLIGKLPEGTSCQGLLESVWKCNSTASSLYQHFVLSDETLPLTTGEEGMEASLSDVVSQLLEVFTSILTYPGLKKACESSLVDVATCVIQYYMVIPFEDVDEWTEDCNLFLSSGGDYWGCRGSSGLLLDSILESYSSKGAHAIQEAVKKTIAIAEASASQNNSSYWKLMESTLLALSELADYFMEGKQRKILSDSGSCMNPNFFLQWILSNSMYCSPGTPLLLSRIFIYAGRYSKVLTEETRNMVIRCLGECLSGTGLKPAVYGGILQGLAPVIKHCAIEQVRPVSNRFMGYLCQMLHSATDDTMHLILENIQELLHKDPSCAVSWTDKVIPVAMTAWIDNFNDPLLGEDAFNLLRKIARGPGGVQSMVSIAVPTIKTILQSNTAPPLLISSSFDMLVEMTSPANSADVKSVFVEFMPVGMQMLHSTQDEDIIAAVSAFIRTSLQLGKAESLGWFFPSEDVSIATFVQVIKYLLRPDTPDRGARYVGGIILSLFQAATLEKLGQDVVSDILKSVAEKLHVAENPSTVQSLITVVASLARIDASLLVTILASIGGTPSALQLVMDKWVERHIEIRTPYDIKLSILALSNILQCPNPLIDQVMVKGQRTDTSTSIRTRSRAATVKEEWSMILLRCKIALLLLDSYIEAETQGMPDDDEDEWIEDDEDDAEYNDDDDDNDEPINSIYSMYGELLGEEDFDVDLADIDYLEVQRRETDSLNSLSTIEHVSSVLKMFEQSYHQSFSGLYQICSPIQAASLKQALTSKI